VPVDGVLTHAADHALDLALTDRDAANLAQVLGGLEEAALFTARQADQAGKGRGVGTLQPQSGIGG